MSKSCKDGRDSHETQIEKELCRRLAACGQSYQLQARTVAGVMDVLTEDAIYEVKEYLSRVKTFEAIGQLLTYRHYSPGRRMVLVSSDPPPEIFAAVLEALGIELLVIEFCPRCWQPMPKRHTRAGRLADGTA